MQQHTIPETPLRVPQVDLSGGNLISISFSQDFVTPVSFYTQFIDIKALSFAMLALKAFYLLAVGLVQVVNHGKDFTDH